MSHHVAPLWYMSVQEAMVETPNVSWKPWEGFGLLTLGTQGYLWFVTVFTKGIESDTRGFQWVVRNGFRPSTVWV